MPSPFPGMDPYLESSTWMNFHGQLVRGDRARQLGPKLRPRYLKRGWTGAFLHGYFR